MNAEASEYWDEGVIRCTQCERKIDELAAIAERWTYWSDGIAELHPFCPECAEREFAHTQGRTP